ncbi:hypothetical protein NPIL_666361 [Nephila pilipes]|uniref:Uncharacterized protein n=1 Tax=Nephila pilipes TaxID=299642 RepID=A0A8X6TAW7_NEPPI|nr:hypothetical protein NPIL_666361 [Nephila pilipes]
MGRSSWLWSSKTMVGRSDMVLSEEYRLSGFQCFGCFCKVKIDDVTLDLYFGWREPAWPQVLTTSRCSNN